MLIQLTMNRIKKTRKAVPKTILLASFLAAMGTTVLAFALPLVSLSETVSGSWLGSLFALYFLTRLLAAPLGGMWADRSGPRRPFLTACALGMLAPALCLLLPGLPALHAAQFLLGISGGMARPAALTALAQATDKDTRPLWMGRHAGTMNAALFLGPLVSGLLYFHRDLTCVLLGLLVAMLLAALVGLRFPASPGPARPVAKDAARRSAAPLLLAIAGRTVGIGALIAFYPLLLAQTLAANTFTLALLFSVANCIALLGLPFSGALLRGHKPGLLTALGMAISTLALFALGLAQTPLQYTLLGVLMGVGMTISLPASMTLAATLSPSPGKLFGTAHGAAGLGLLLGPVLGGAALRWTGSTGSALTLTALVGIPLILPLLFTELQRLPGWSRAYTLLTGTLAALLLAVLIPLSGLLPETTPDNALYVYTDTAMGTVVRLTFAAPDKPAAKRLAQRVMNRIRNWQQDLDHRNPEGSIGRINSAAGNHAVTVTPRAVALVRRSLEYARQTDGAFDPTVGAVTTVPFYFALDPAINEAKASLVDYRKVQIRGETVFLERKGMALDLGGIAKGAIIDQAVRALQDRDILSGMVEAGGDFRVFGNHQWTLGVQNPRGEDNQVIETLRVQNRALCTSGDYRRFVLLDQSGSARRHHIITPATATSATSCISVTVLADTAEQADALATSFFVMGPAKGLAFLKASGKNVQAQWIMPDLSRISSPGFPAQ